MTKGLRIWVQGIGLLGPGLTSWSSAHAVLSGGQSIAPAPTVLPVPVRLPPAERRRAGAAVKLALAVADEAVAQAGLDPALLATVFCSSSGEGVNCHALCETLATSAPMVSPTRFTNSVHNAAAGCWHIAVASRATSTSVCAFDASFGAGLIEAASSVHVARQPLLLVASDSPYPEPLHAARPLPDHFGAAFVLTPEQTPHSLAELAISFDSSGSAVSTCTDVALESLRTAIPAARALPLLEALARPRAARRIVLDYLPNLHVRVELT